jgi:hypothetical protein
LKLCGLCLICIFVFSSILHEPLHCGHSNYSSTIACTGTAGRVPVSSNETVLQLSNIYPGIVAFHYFQVDEVMKKYSKPMRNSSYGAYIHTSNGNDIAPEMQVTVVNRYAWFVQWPRNAGGRETIVRESEEGCAIMQRNRKGI